ncbi:MAG TPA: methyltransferase domain-containing protein [Methylophilaceae bacterium]|nr:methyltransferase domain-containing protein [Methylophilaceae bacterium]
MQPNNQENWFETTLGKYMLSQEQSIYNLAVGNVFGFYAVQIGMPQLDCLQNSRIPNIIYAGNRSGNLYCESTYLPFASNSVDLVCMPHVLGFSENPHQSLREASRVLVPEGYLIIAGFNPFSAWGIRRMFSNKKAYPWFGAFFSLSRIKDWLALLDLEFVEVEFLSHGLPLNNQKWLKRLSFTNKIGEKWWPMLGGQYIIVAKKRVVNITLLKPKWKRSLLQPSIAVSGHKNTNHSRKKDLNQD